MNKLSTLKQELASTVLAGRLDLKPKQVRIVPAIKMTELYRDQTVCDPASHCDVLFVRAVEKNKVL